MKRITRRVHIVTTTETWTVTTAPLEAKPAAPERANGEQPLDGEHSPVDESELNALDDAGAQDEATGTADAANDDPGAGPPLGVYE
jgi:hypothetical protein